MSGSPRTSASRPASRALLVSEVFPPQIGGSGEFLANVYRRMAVDVTVLCDGPERAFAHDEDGLHVIRAPMRSTQWGLAHPIGIRAHWRGVTSLWALARRVAPSVLHCGRSLPEGLDVWTVAKLMRRPYVCWAHGEEIACQAESRELGLLMRRVLRGADAIVANSRATARAVGSLGVDDGRVTVVYPGVDASRFRPDVPDAAALRAELAAPDTFVLLTVGRLQRRKGHDLVLQAIARLVPDVALRYVIVGDGDERARLQQLSRELGLDAHVHFAGAVPAERLPSYYAAADCFVHPNRVDGSDVEGFGIVFLEAAASGLAVIGGSSGGAAEAVADGETGILVSGTDVDELSRALLALIRDPERRRAMGAVGRARAAGTFTWERAAEAVGAIHQRLSEHRA
jgi:phosphatidylinositol alpha-1,6-mannosyltransferase